MWRKLQTYQSGEELFGLPQTDYPELAQIRKELNLLQKLYKLYNDVIDQVSGYYDIPWGEVNIEEINNELMEFQNRCRKLPKGLKVSVSVYCQKLAMASFNRWFFRRNEVLYKTAGLNISFWEITTFLIKTIVLWH